MVNRLCPRQVTHDTRNVKSQEEFHTDRYLQGMVELIIKDSGKSLDDLL